MGERVRSVNRLLKRQDTQLFATERADGCIIVWHRSEPWQRGDTRDAGELASLRIQPIFALTNDWTLQGEPVEWGLEPLYWKLRDSDSNRDDSYFEEMVSTRLRDKELRFRAASNENKAIAADERRTFARAFNDINTSTLDKIDNRRKKDNAYRQ
jgi:hypothetical protein